MKVQNDQIQALQTSEAHRKTKVAADGFNNLFAEHLEVEAAKSVSEQNFKAGASFNANTTLAMLLNESASLDGSGQENDENSNLDATDRIGGLLDKWDTYAASLSGLDKAVSSKTGEKGAPDLRSIYGLLEGMSQEVQALRASMPELSKQNGNLDSLLNELEVMTVTEKFKFNRGDYL